MEVRDNIEISKIEVSIDAENYIEISNTYTFDGLSDRTEYNVKIINSFCISRINFLSRSNIM